MRWKNGGGMTTEIAVSPAGAGLDDFDWRVSMARIEGDGPFSLFAGIDRTLAILEGAGIFLCVADRIPIGLTRASQPLPFPADTPTRAGLIDGPITDLNVMTRRGRLTHSVERLALATSVAIACDAENTLILCADGTVVANADTAVQLAPLDVLLLDRGSAEVRVDPLSPSTLFAIRIRPAARND